MNQMEKGTMSALTEPFGHATSRPPGPRLAPLQTALYMRDPRGYTHRLREKYGDVVAMPTMNGVIVLAMTSEGAKEILALPMERFSEAFGADTLSPVLGEGSLLLLTGRRHRAERKILSPTFHGNRMRSLSSAMKEATVDRMQTWSMGKKINVLEEMQAISLDIIIRAVLGIEDSERCHLFRVAIREAIQDANPALFFFKVAQHRFGGIGPWARFLKKRDRLHRLMNEQIQLARVQKGEPRPYILSRLVHASREDGEPFSDNSIRDHLLTLLVAGHETTASALAWTFYELGRNPDVQTWLLAEMNDPTAVSEKRARLSALEATARESLRLHPIIGEFFRPVRESMTFQGYSIPAGTILAGSAIEIHKDESLYPQPDAFRPSRFLERGFAPHEFASFGGGHRHCLGSAFALTEMSIVMGTILPQIRFEPTSNEPVGVQLRNVTMAPAGGIDVIVRQG